jgi:hypothetical protein
MSYFCHISLFYYFSVVPYEVTITTGDVPEAGTDATLYMKVFGANGATSEVLLDKLSERFERGRSDLIKASHQF